MMRADALNSDKYSVRIKMTATKQIPSLYVCSTDKSELKEFLVDETLSSKGIIADKCSTEEYKS